MSIKSLVVAFIAVFLTVMPVQAQSITARLDVSSEQAEQGDQIEVEVLVDLSSISEKLGAYEARLSWDAEVLEFVQIANGDTPAFANPQTRTSAGELVFSNFNVQGAGGVVSLLKVTFEVIGQPGQTTALNLSFAVLDAAGTFANLLPQLQVQSSTIRVAQAPTISARLDVSSEQPKPGDQIEVEVLVDLSGISEKLGAYEARLNWDAGVLELVEVSDGETSAFANPQTRTGSGELVFSNFNVQGVGGVISALKVSFNVRGRSGQSTALDLSFAVLDAAGTFTNLLPQLQVQFSAIRVGEAAEPQYTVVIGLKMVAGGARIINDLISLRAGSRAEFRATVTDEEGNPVDVPVMWKTLGEAGTITSAAQFTASEQAGDKGSIIAQTEDGFADTLSVNIIANLLKRIELAPESVVLSVGKRVTFKAQGYDAHGNSISVRPFWHIAGDVGTISSITGTFVAKGVGVGYVVAFSQAVFGDAETGVEGTAKVVVRSSLPASYALSQNFPNPFNPMTTIRYVLPRASAVRLVVYDLWGSPVRVLADGLKEPGYYQAVWDGRDRRGQEVSSGVYIVRLEAGERLKQVAFSKSRRITLIR